MGLMSCVPRPKVSPSHSIQTAGPWGPPTIKAQAEKKNVNFKAPNQSICPQRLKSICQGANVLRKGCQR